MSTNAVPWTVYGVAAILVLSRDLAPASHTPAGALGCGVERFYPEAET